MTYSSWFFDKVDFKRTPSVLDGISVETEQRYRREGARFINKVGTKMNLRYDTMATGVVYFHRFYMCHSFKQFPRYITASCCLFLAGKVEETPKKCKDIIKTAKLFITDAQFLKFGEDPKEEVLTLERILLQTINFDLQVDHPYNYLLKYAKILVGDKEKLQKMVQMAWTFINDSMCTTICLQWEPEVTAIALMFLSGKLTKFEVVDWEGRTPKHNKWWDMFVEDISTDLLEDICHQVLDLYSMPMPDTPIDSPPTSPPPAMFDSNSSIQTQPAVSNRSNLIQLSNSSEMSGGFSNSLPASNQQPISVIPAINNNLPMSSSIPNHQPMLAGTNQMARMPIPMNINHQQLISQQNYNYKSIHTVHPTLISPHQPPNLTNSTGPPMPPMSGTVGTMPQQFYRYQNQGPHIPNNGHQNSNQLVSGPPTYPNM